MTNERNLAEELFHKVVSLAPADRLAVLDTECGQDVHLRRRVEALLKAYDQSNELSAEPLDEIAATLDSEQDEVASANTATLSSDAQRIGSSAADATTLDDRVEFEPGTLIANRYRLQQVIGEGGMGAVWMARQSAPVKRQVALKLIKTGMDSRAVLARFEQERQALAVMNHPNIARVLDGGMTSTGQPFFAMELVDGLALNRFCDKSKLTPKERLELFVPICHAVQHAHQKGIVHRDLKPANIIVSMIDGKPVPKVIDFGVAKATGGKLTDQTMATEIGAVVGTLEYMSPEQADFTIVDIDTRADIYALGVILYELLTGLRPIDARRLKKAGLAEMVRVIKEEEPSKPSTKVSTNESLPTLAAVRSTEPNKLAALLRGELDWVVMKCLEKERERRYETANALARDIQRYLVDEPVEARPPSTGYRLRKFLKRNKGPVSAISLVFVVLIGGIVGTSYGLLRADRALKDAQAAREAEAERAEGERLAKLEARKQTAQAEEAAAKEKAANEQAQKRLSQIEKSNQILGSIFASLRPEEIAESKRPLQETLVDKLDEAVRQLEGEAIGAPLVVARMQDQLGMSLLALSAPEKACVLLEKALATHDSLLGPNDLTTIASMNNLAECYLDSGQLKKALDLFKTTYERHLAVLGPDHPDTATSCNNLALAYKDSGSFDVALPLLEKTVKWQKAHLGVNDPETLTSMTNLAAAYQDVGQPNQALPIFKETLKIRKENLGPKHPDTLLCMNNLAFSYESIGDLDRALPLYEETLELMEATLGASHSSTLGTMGNLGALYRELGDLTLAIPLLKKTAKLTEEEFGPNHPDTLLSLSNLASGYQAAGNLKLALPLCESTFKRMKEKLGHDHPHSIMGMNNLALCYQLTGKLDLALPLFKDALKLMRAKLGQDHPETLTCMGNLATVYQDMGKIEFALPLFEEAIKKQKATLGVDHPSTLLTMNNLAVAYWSTKQLDKSVPLFEELVDRTSEMMGRDHPNTLMTIVNLGVNLKDSGEIEKALPLLKEGYEAGEQYPGLKSIAGPQLLNGYAQAGDKDKAVALAHELLNELEAQFPEGSPQRAGLLAQFSMALIQVKSYTEAEGLLRECLSIREESEPDSWLFFNTQSLLGGALLGQKKYSKAEPLLFSGYEGLKECQATTPKIRLVESLERLLQWAKETENSEQAERWQAELDSQ